MAPKEQSPSTTTRNPEMYELTTEMKEGPPLAFDSFDLLLLPRGFDTN